MTEPTEEVLTLAAKDGSLPDNSFIMISRALAGLDPLTGKVPVPALPKRMTGRGWRLNPFQGVWTAEHIGWYWRCPRRKSCGAWGGPFHCEAEAWADGRAQHHNAHRKA